MYDLKLVLNIRDYLAVEEVDGPLGYGSILLGVGHHYDGGSFLVEFGEEIHNLLAIL